MSAADLTTEELSLLRSYADGPRIWDAASVFEVVLRLAAKGLVEPADGDGGRYALTDAGRDVLNQYLAAGAKRLTVTVDVDLADDDNQYRVTDHRHIGDAIEAGKIAVPATVHIEFGTGDVVNGTLVSVELEGTPNK